MMDLPYRAFRIDGDDGFVEIWVDSEAEWTAPDGGLHYYKGHISLEVQCFHIVDGPLEFSDKNIIEFKKALESCTGELCGIAQFQAMQSPFEMTVELLKTGRAKLKGRYKEKYESDSNYLDFEIKTDQTYIVSSIKQFQCAEG